MATAASGVVIVGAGPTGLLLASEIALAGVPCRVLERRSGPRQDSRAICLHARSMEALDLRGQAQMFSDAGLPVPGFPLGPRGAEINFGVLDSDFPYMLDIPQSRIERLLLDRALELGVEVRWSATATGVSQNADGVTVTLADGSAVRGDFVVGCDGVHSFVRSSAGIPFPGIDNPGSVILADLRLDGLPMDAAYGDLSGAGMLLVFPFRDGTCRVVLYDYSRAEVPVTEMVDMAEVKVSLRRLAGRDLGPRDLYWSRRYRSESRQAPRYREGRVLLAGDAAHAHSPAGAQGMNTGLQDAVNLGWKLAAAVRGGGPDWLLDSYHAERHPVGAGVLALTGRQFRLNTARSLSGRLRRWAMHRLIVPLPPVQGRLARDYSGISISYSLEPERAEVLSRFVGEAVPVRHALAGTRLPPGVVTLAEGGTRRVYELFHDGRFVLLDRAGDSGEILPDRIRTVRYTRCEPGGLPLAVLIRPDGYIAWASDEADAGVRARAADAAGRLWCASHLTGCE